MNLKAFHPSGGIKYHVSAFLNRKRWQPFSDYVEFWLMDWLKFLKAKEVSTLVLIGPNAGYTLPRAFVSQFENVIVVEPDPLAFALFEVRFNCHARWVHQDYFDLKNKGSDLTSNFEPNPEKLMGLFSAYPKAAFLFCNILGQLPVILRENGSLNIEKYMSRLGVVLDEAAKTYIFASYHDKFSRNLKKPSEVIDHLTGDLFKSCTNKKEFPWRLSRHIEHQIEFCKNRF